MSDDEERLRAMADAANVLLNILMNYGEAEAKKEDMDRAYERLRRNVDDYFDREAAKLT